MSNEHHTLAGTTASQYLGEGRHLVNGDFWTPVRANIGRNPGKARVGSVGVLSPQAGGAADKAASSLIETQKAVRRFRNPNASANSHAGSPFEIELLGVRVAGRRHFAEP